MSACQVAGFYYEEEKTPEPSELKKPGNVRIPSMCCIKVILCGGKVNRPCSLPEGAIRARLHSIA